MADPASKVMRYLELDTEIELLQTQMKLLKKEHNTLNQDILQIMLVQNASKFETPSINLVRSETVGQATLSIPLITTVCNHIFARPELTAKFIAALQDHRKALAGKRIRLKRIKRRAVVEE